MVIVLMRFSAMRHVAVLTVLLFRLSTWTCTTPSRGRAVKFCHCVLGRPRARGARPAGGQLLVVARVTRCCILILSVVSGLGIESFDMT